MRLATLFLATLLLILSGCSLLPSTRPPDNATQRQALVKTALAQRGVPYRFGGTDPKGFDCSGLVRYVYQQQGITAPRSAAEQMHASRPVAHQEMQPGDLLFFRLGRRNNIHVGIYIGEDHFIHAPSSGKTVIESSLQNVYWRKRFIRAGRLQ